MEVEVVGVPDEVAVEQLLDWVGGCTEPLVGPVRVTRLEGGRSNISIRVQDSAAADYVVRRPPLGEVLATAHDVAREYHILRALAGTAVPVPQVRDLRRASPSSGSVDAYIMDFVEGQVLERRADVADMATAGRRHAGEQIIDTLVELHAIDPGDVGLSDLGRSSGYLDRQLRRWRRQWEASIDEPNPDMDRVYEWLVAHRPSSREGRIVHGDYRFGNCIFASTGELRAVLDWELCTLGDPMADVGYMLLSWDEPGDRYPVTDDGPTTESGFLTRDQALARYIERSGRDSSAIDYHIALQAWRLACINQGVYARHLSGHYGQDRGDLSTYEDGVHRMIRIASRSIK